MRFISIILITIFLTLVLISCSPVVQIFDVRSSNCKIENEYLYSENDTLRVVYIFWGENGTMGIFIHNKSELPLYIDWKKCSFVVGESKNDYWEDATTTVTNNTSTSIGNAQQKGSASASYWFNNFLSNIISSNSNSSWFQQTFSSSISRITKPERITFIPPHATICQSAYNLMATGMSLEGSSTFKDTVVNIKWSTTGQFTPTKISLQTVKYNMSNTPLRFRFYLTFSHDEQFKTETHLDNHFYISQLTQLSKDEFDAIPMPSSHEKSNRNIWASPTRFYVRIQSE